jgi:GNAT superfamily N-acetyltransferase
MATSGLSIDTVRVADLPRLARDVEAEPARYPVVPITPPRAAAHARNPAADPGQTGLLMASVDGRCVGFLGLLPIVLDDQGRRHAVDCLSTLYVAPEHRHTGAGSLLVLRAMSLGRDLVAVGTSDAATRVLQALGFARGGPLRALKLRIEALMGVSFALGAAGRTIEGTALRGLGRAFDASRRIIERSLDPGLRRLLVRLPRRLLGEAGRDVAIRPTRRVERPPDFAPVGAPVVAPRFVRDAAIVNWMIDCPWIDEDGRRPSAYAFSHHRDRFRFLPFEIRRRPTGEYLGDVVYSVSAQEGRTTIKILDHALRDESLRPCVLAHALREAHRWSAGTLEGSEAWWGLVAASPVLRRAALLAERAYLVRPRSGGGALQERWRDLAVGYCDGEAPFT